MPATRVKILLDEPIGVIRPELHGHFVEHLGACVDGGVWVGDDCPDIAHVGGVRADVAEAVRRINPPVIRWPGGCFADDYHWRDGIGPRASRPRTVNLHWGQTIETNGFGTHEFMNFCQLVGARPYLGGNVGSGSPREMRDWVEYCNFTGDSTLARERGENGSPRPFAVRHWGVGNENWGCGGAFCPEDYAAEYKRFATYLPDFSDTPLYLIACGPDCGGRPNFHLDWTNRFFAKLDSFKRIHGFAAHYYCGTAGTATEYSSDQWYELLERAARIEDAIVAHRSAMDVFDPQRKIGLLFDEWGTWHPPAPGRNPKHLWQQNTMRDALVAAITLDTFHRHADKLVMCNIAQLANVLQAMVLTDGPRMITTPTYHVFDLYQSHRDGQSVRTMIEGDNPISFAAGDERRTTRRVTGSASFRGGEITISLVNAHASIPADVRLELSSGQIRSARIATLVHEDFTAHNSFDEPNVVVPEHASRDEVEALRLAPASVTVIRAQVR